MHERGTRRGVLPTRVRVFSRHGRVFTSIRIEPKLNPTSTNFELRIRRNIQSMASMHNQNARYGIENIRRTKLKVAYLLS